MQKKACVKRVRDFLRKHGIETCGRFGEWGYLWTDQTILSGKCAAEAKTFRKVMKDRKNRPYSCSCTFR